MFTSLFDVANVCVCVALAFVLLFALWACTKSTIAYNNVVPMHKYGRLRCGKKKTKACALAYNQYILTTTRTRQQILPPERKIASSVVLLWYYRTQWRHILCIWTVNTPLIHTHRVSRHRAAGARSSEYFSPVFSVNFFCLLFFLLFRGYAHILALSPSLFLYFGYPIFAYKYIFGCRHMKCLHKAHT